MSAGSAAKAQDTTRTGSTYVLNVEGQPLGQALQTLTSVTDLPLAYAPDLVTDRRTRCRKRRGIAETLLRCVLEETGLRARQLPSGTYVLERRPPEEPKENESDAPATIRGRVESQATGQPVPRASVQVEGTFIGTAAGEQGRYQVELPPGRQVLRFGALGYETVRRTVAARPGDTTRADVSLVPKQLQLGSVTVEAERAGAAATTPSLFRLNPETATNAPALGEPDVVRVLSLLPGVTQANDIKAGLNVRGGAADQNQFLLDGIEVYNPNHLLGILGAFNVWALSGADVYTSGVPARYGGRLSSVVALETRAPPEPRDSAFAKGNLSLLSAGGAYARRFGKTGVIVAARRTYADPVLAALKQNVGYNFYDANLKLTRPLGAGFAVEVIGFTNRDALSGNPDASKSTPLHFDWGNRVAALRLKQKTGRWRHRLTASHARNFAEARYGEAGTPALGSIDNAFTDWTGRYRGDAVFRKNRLSFGASMKRLSAEQKWDGRAFGEDFEDLFYLGAPEVFGRERQKSLYSGYLSGESYLTDRWVLRSGLRYSRLGGRDGGGALQPRGRITFEATGDWTFTAGAGRYAQYVAEGTEGRELTIQQPTFLLEEPQTGWTVSSGATWTPSGGRYRISAEGYARRFDRFARLGAEARAQEKTTFSGDAGKAADAPYPDFTYGTGSAYGLDLFLKKTRGWMTGQLAYSFSRVRLDFGGDPYPPTWSTPHSLKGLIGLSLGPWHLGVAGTLRSGRPYTPVVGRFYGPVAGDPAGTEEQFLLGKPNSERFPFYGRMDLSLRRTYQADRFDWTLYLQALNLFNRANPQRFETARFYTFGIDRQRGGTPAGLVRSLPVIPSVGVEFTF